MIPIASLVSFDPFLSGYDESRGREFYRRLSARVRTVSGVQSVTLARRLPLTAGGIAFANAVIDGYAAGRDEDMRFNYETVGPGLTCRGVDLTWTTFGGLRAPIRP